MHFMTKYINKKLSWIKKQSAYHHQSLPTKKHESYVLKNVVLALWIKKGSANDSSGLYIAIHTPWNAAAFSPTQTAAWFSDTFVKALPPNSLFPKQKIIKCQNSELSYKLKKNLDLLMKNSGYQMKQPNSK